MIVNLLTEDNLPSYHREIATRFGRDGAWGQWVGRWTAEEGRHAIAIRDYLVVTRGVDPVRLEALRMEHMRRLRQRRQDHAPGAGLRLVPGAGHPDLAPQHRACDWLPACRAVARSHIHGREPAHGLLPQPDGRGVRPGAGRGDAAIRDEVVGFQMPGKGMTDFARNAVNIAKAGIYDLRLHHDEVIQPVLRNWGIFERTDLGPAGERARDELSFFLAMLDAKAKHYEEKRAARAEVRRTA